MSTKRVVGMTIRLFSLNNNLFKIPGSGFVFAASEYPSMTNNEIIQYTSVLFTQAPFHVCLDGPIIDSRTILVTTSMYYCGYVGV